MSVQVSSSPVSLITRPVKCCEVAEEEDYGTLEIKLTPSVATILQVAF